ncbi:hypothetical protein HDU67_002605 [Dinochytrium kinnereticum]|nr:hypothetical protein HDU67_002605 [Dinochytrium kinnereticum]
MLTASAPDETATNPDHHQMMTETIPMKDAVALLYHPLYDFIPEEERAAFISFFLRNHEELAASYIKQGGNPKGVWKGPTHLTKDDAFQSLQDLRTKIKVIHFVKKQHPKAPSKFLPQLVDLEKTRREIQRELCLTERNLKIQVTNLERREVELGTARKEGCRKVLAMALRKKSEAVEPVVTLKRKLADLAKEEKDVREKYRRAVLRMNDLIQLED